MIHEGIFPSERYQYGTDKNIPLSNFTDWKDGIYGLKPIEETFSVNKWRLAFIILVIFGLMLLLIGRLFDLQIIKGPMYSLLAERNRIYNRTIAPERGVIYDRNGEVLARNEEVNSLALVLAEVEEEQRVQLINEITEIFELDETNIQKYFDTALKSPKTPLTIKHKISYEQQVTFEVKREQLKGLYLVKETIRRYPVQPIFSTVLGYMGEISEIELSQNQNQNYSSGMLIGKDGVEKQYNQILSGTLGQAVVEIDAQNQVLNEIITQTPITGENLYLTLDAKIQAKIYALLEQAIQTYKATGGSVIIGNPENGEIYGLVSIPTYDNNIFFDDPNQVSQVLNDQRGLLLNRAISGIYAPGSTVKMAIGCWAIAKGNITAQTIISDDPQVIYVGGWQFPDWTYTFGRGPFGLMDFAKALSVSSDIYFYKIGGGYPPDCGGTNNLCQVNGLGSDELANSLRAFGMGSYVGIDLPNEAKGLVPDAQWKEAARSEAWYLGDTYHLSIGQGDLLVTPLQIYNLTNIISLDQQTSIPHVAKDKFQNEFKDKPVSLEIIRSARAGMVKAVSEGIIYPLRTCPVKVAAKTGTAEFGSLNAKGEYATHAWVTGFAPADNPQISFTFMLESGGGSTNAAELAKEFIDWYFTQNTDGSTNKAIN